MMPVEDARICSHPEQQQQEQHHRRDCVDDCHYGTAVECGPCSVYLMLLTSGERLRTGTRASWIFDGISNEFAAHRGGQRVYRIIPYRLIINKCSANVEQESSVVFVRKQPSVSRRRPSVWLFNWKIRGDMHQRKGLLTVQSDRDR